METHCDDYIRDKTKPKCLRWYLLINRMPAYQKHEGIAKKRWKDPLLYATLVNNSDWVDGEGTIYIPAETRVRVVMASRFGDVGISRNLHKPHGYEMRVELNELKDFSNKIKGCEKCKNCSSTMVTNSLWNRIKLTIKWFLSILRRLLS